MLLLAKFFVFGYFEEYLEYWCFE